jgi:hypothetical protein
VARRCVYEEGDYGQELETESCGPSQCRHGVHAWVFFLFVNMHVRPKKIGCFCCHFLAY